MYLRVRCPAKINLFLSVGPKDNRNYHPLRTVFQAIELSDTLIIRDGVDKTQVVCDDPSVPRDNTATKALRLLSEVISLPPLHISIEKRIPQQSGLGGGSSDGAGVIRAAQAISGSSIPAGELKGIAEAIGMDVPFFLVGGLARAEGYGEVLSPLPDAKRSWILVARPSVGCSTPEAYRRLDEITYPWREFPHVDEIYNDFERVAPEESMELIGFLKEYGACDAALSGSGSAVFGIFKSREAAESAATLLRGYQATSVWVSQSITRAESLVIETL